MKKFKVLGIVVVIAMVFGFVACEGDDDPVLPPGSKVPQPILEPANKGPFETVDLFEGNTASIKDERVNGGSQDLVEMGIVSRIEGAITEGFNDGTGMAATANKTRFRNVFGADGGVTIIVDNPATPYKVKAPNGNTIYFHINHLSSLSDADLQAAIVAAVAAMNPAAPDLPFEITKAIGSGTIRIASVGASGQHLKPLTNPKKIRVRERRAEREYFAMVNAQKGIAQGIAESRQIQG